MVLEVFEPDYDIKIDCGYFRSLFLYCNMETDMIE